MLEALKIIVPSIAAIIAAITAYRVGVKRAEASASALIAQAEAAAAAVLAQAAVVRDESAVNGWSELAAEYRGQFEGLTRQVTTLQASVDTAMSKIRVLEQERDQHQFWRLIGVEYITACLALLAEHNIPAPPQPPGLKLS